MLHTLLLLQARPSPAWLSLRATPAWPRRLPQCLTFFHHFGAGWGPWERLERLVIVCCRPAAARDCCLAGAATCGDEACKAAPCEPTSAKVMNMLGAVAEDVAKLAVAPPGCVCWGGRAVRGTGQCDLGAHQCMRTARASAAPQAGRATGSIAPTSTSAPCTLTVRPDECVLLGSYPCSTPRLLAGRPRGPPVSHGVRCAAAEAAALPPHCRPMTASASRRLRPAVPQHSRLVRVRLQQGIYAGGRLHSRARQGAAQPAQAARRLPLPRTACLAQTSALPRHLPTHSTAGRAPPACASLTLSLPAAGSPPGSSRC